MTFDSAYGKEFNVEILNESVLPHFTLREESIQRGPDPATVLVVAYTNCENHFYLGDRKTAKYIVEDLGITEQLQPVPGGKTVAVGFNPETQQWFGWSHRACASFGIGTEVSKGSCGFVPSNREEFEESCKEFWDIGKKQEMQPGLFRTREFVEFQHDVIDREVSTFEAIAVLRFADVYDPAPPATVDPKASPIRDMPVMYPRLWGRGEWKAETLEDAKQMAIDFANGVG